MHPELLVNNIRISNVDIEMNPLKGVRYWMTNVTRKILGDTILLNNALSGDKNFFIDAKSKEIYYLGNPNIVAQAASYPLGVAPILDPARLLYAVSDLRNGSESYSQDDVESIRAEVATKIRSIPAANDNEYRIAA